jgi:broad specificity phosphatase PhoE
VRRLLLVRHAPTAATRGSVLPRDEPLDDAGRAAAAAFGAAIARADVTLCSPSLRSRQTVAAAGLGRPQVVPELAECDFGDWAGRTLTEICAADPQAATAWMTDPQASPHGGESLTAFTGRIAGWLDRQAGLAGSALAVTHGGVVKAAVVHALGAPPDAFWRIDVRPLTVTELHSHDGRWTLVRTNSPIAR